jgi:hypothetical protein
MGSAFDGHFGMDMKVYAGVVELSDVIEIAKEIDFQAVNAEKLKLIETLTGLVTKKEFEAFVFKTVEFKKNQISQTDFCNFLIALATNYNLPRSEYTNLVKFTEYISVYEIIQKFEQGKERPYIAVLTDRRKPYQNLLDSWKYQLAVAVYFYSAEGDLSKLQEGIFLALGESSFWGNAHGVREDLPVGIYTSRLSRKSISASLRMRSKDMKRYS